MGERLQRHNRSPIEKGKINKIVMQYGNGSKENGARPGKGGEDISCNPSCTSESQPTVPTENKNSATIRLTN